MRKWLVLFLAIALLFFLPKFNTRWSRRRFPLMKRIDQAITVVTAVLFVVYVVAFVYWLLSRK
jgi:hypothetical protein